MHDMDRRNNPTSTCYASKITENPQCCLKLLRLYVTFVLKWERIIQNWYNFCRAEWSGFYVVMHGSRYGPFEGIKSDDHSFDRSLICSSMMMAIRLWAVNNRCKKWCTVCHALPPFQSSLMIVWEERFTSNGRRRIIIGENVHIDFL
jgi:hypothetical protein